MHLLALSAFLFTLALKRFTAYYSISVDILFYIVYIKTVCNYAKKNNIYIYKDLSTQT